MGIIINLDKAKEITKDRLRQERAPLLAEQDVAFQRALELGADTSAIVAEKERLRTIPSLADTATTLDELVALNCDKPVVEVVEEPVSEPVVEEPVVEPIVEEGV